MQNTRDVQCVCVRVSVCAHGCVRMGVCVCLSVRPYIHTQLCRLIMYRIAICFDRRMQETEDMKHTGITIVMYISVVQNA